MRRILILKAYECKQLDYKYLKNEVTGEVLIQGKGIHQINLQIRGFIKGLEYSNVFVKFLVDEQLNKKEFEYPKNDFSDIPDFKESEGELCFRA